MARRRCIDQSEFPYHITGRTPNRCDFSIPLSDVWKIMTDELWLTHHLYNLKVHSFVLMPNHFHLLASTPDGNLSKAMHSFMGNSSKEINRKAKKINQNYGSRYFRTIVDSYDYFCVAYKYVYRNPVSCGLSTKVEEYSYSTIQMLLGQQPLTIPLERDDLLFNDIDAELKWLNQAPRSDVWSEVRRGMKKTHFNNTIKRSDRRPYHFSKSNF